MVEFKLSKSKEGLSQKIRQLFPLKPEFRARYIFEEQKNLVAEGGFGIVYKGYMIIDEWKKVPVAIKKYKVKIGEEAEWEDFYSMCQEALLLKDHGNMLIL
jgi:hypothetical protein